MKLNEIIGMAAYFPPESVEYPLNFDLSTAELLDDFDPMKSRDGRWLVPLPHPSGASLWPNRPQNRRLIQRAINIISSLREAWSL